MAHLCGTRDKQRHLVHRVTSSDGWTNSQSHAGNVHYPYTAIYTIFFLQISFFLTRQINISSNFIHNNFPPEPCFLQSIFLRNCRRSNRNPADVPRLVNYTSRSISKETQSQTQWNETRGEGFFIAISSSTPWAWINERKILPPPSLTPSITDDRARKGKRKEMKNIPFKKMSEINSKIPLKVGTSPPNKNFSRRPTWAAVLEFTFYQSVERQIPIHDDDKAPPSVEIAFENPAEWIQRK